MRLLRDKIYYNRNESEMNMPRINRMLPYILTMIFLFYLLPLLINDMFFAITILLIILPLSCFAIGLSYSNKYKFNIWFVLLVGLMFIPSIFVFYNYTAWPYAMVYTLFTLIGSCLGSLHNKNKAGKCKT